MDGIAFDVQYWEISPNFDTDLDGIADGGMIDGQPRWAQGVYEYSKSIREHFGDDFIIRLSTFCGEMKQPVFDVVFAQSGRTSNGRS